MNKRHTRRRPHGCQEIYNCQEIERLLERQVHGGICLVDEGSSNQGTS